MAKKIPLFRASYDDPRNKRDAMFTDHVCCIPDEDALQSMRDTGLTIYVNGKKVVGKIPKAQLKDTAPCPVNKKDCPYILLS